MLTSPLFILKAEKGGFFAYELVVTARRLTCHAESSNPGCICALSVSMLVSLSAMHESSIYSCVLAVWVCPFLLTFLLLCFVLGTVQAAVRTPVF